MRLAQEHPTWGSGKLEGERGTWGYTVGCSTIRAILQRKRAPPAPERGRYGSTWHTFLRHDHDQIVACDCCTVDPACLKTRSVLFFIALGRRRVHRAGCTATPPRTWVTQQARQFGWKLQGRALPLRCLIHDRDTTFPAACDAVVSTEDGTIIWTPVRAPTAHAFAERWIRSVRAEGLDKVVILGARHLHRVVPGDVDDDNQARPRQGSEQQGPVPFQRITASDGPMERQDILGGAVHDDYRHAA